jgi:hypothetical protein
MTLLRATFLTATTLVALACASPAAPPPATAKSAPTRPACDAIDHACDPHEAEGGLAKQCHDLAEASTTDEAVCARRKAECLAACPP